jgi:hypothetical protein
MDDLCRLMGSSRGDRPKRSPEGTARGIARGDPMRNATAIGLVVLLVIIVGAAAYQVLVATG